MKRKYSNLFYVGLALTVIGAIMFFSRVRIGSYLFPRFGSFDTAPLFLVGWALCIALLVFRPSKATRYLLIAATLCLVITVILSAHIYFVQTPMLYFFFILVMLFGGAGLMLREITKK